MKKFETPKIEIMEFAVEDVITASSGPAIESGTTACLPDL